MSPLPGLAYDLSIGSYFKRSNLSKPLAISSILLFTHKLFFNRFPKQSWR
jgi:hypothetical protein